MTSTGSRLAGRIPLLVALAAAGLGIVLVFIMPRGLFSGDEGVKLLQSRALVENGWRSAAIPYPGQDIDPRQKYLPLRPPFVWEHEGSWYGVYSLTYTAATALAWALGGLRAVSLFSWSGAALGLVLLAGLAKKALGWPWATAVVVMTALATPLLLYGTLNFEHSWATALVLGCLLLLTLPEPNGRSQVIAGALLGLGAVIRPELYAFPAGIVAFCLVGWGWRRQTIRRLVFVAAGMILVTGIDLVSRALMFGSFHPNLQVGDLPATTYALNLNRLVPPEITGRGAATLAAAVLIGLMPVRGATSRVARWLAGLILVLVFGHLSWQALAAVTPSVRADTRTVIGLFGATPLALVGLLRGVTARKSEESRLAAACAAAAAVFIVAVVAVKVRGFIGGLELGSRYLLPAAPLLLIGAADYLRRQTPGLQRGLTAAACMLLAVLSLRASLDNAVSTYVIRQDNARLVTAVRESGIEDVITRHFWIPQLMAPIYFEKRIYLNPDRRLLRRMVRAERYRVVGVDLRAGVYSGRNLRLIRGRVGLRPGRVISYRLLTPQEQSP